LPFKRLVMLLAASTELPTTNKEKNIKNGMIIFFIGIVLIVNLLMVNG